MKKALSILLYVAAAGLSMSPAAKDVRTPDALTANPQSISLKLENDNVRVLEARLEPGQKEHMHSHPAYVVYVISGGTLRLHSSDGKTTDLTVNTGDAMYRDPVDQHWGENIGTTPIHLILVELKHD
jgi:quercetin dioxygenase-like cupin family protein